MVAVSLREFLIGLVVHCDPAILIQQGGCETKALPGKEVQGPHYFLILDVNAAEPCLCMPLYSEKERGFSNDWEKLVPRGKTGKAEAWTDCDSYFFKWQFWRVPSSSFEAASQADTSDPSNRRRYGKNEPALRTAIQAYLSRSVHPWRPL
jgi:hypothetical protein